MSGADGIGGYNQINTQTQMDNGYAINGQGRQEGKIDGMSIEMEDPLSALMDNAEELTFARDNSKRTKLADRKMKNENSLYLLKQVAMFAEIVNKVQNADYDARRRIVSNAKNYNGDVKKMLSDMRKLGGNRVHDYVALQIAISEEKNKNVKEFLQQASDELFNSNKSDILSTLNVINVEPNDSSLGSSLELSEKYCELTNNCGNDSLKMLDYISEKFGSNRIDDGVEYMLKALAADLNSPITSQESVLLEDIGSSLSMVRTLNSAKNICNKFTSRLSSQHGVTNQINTGKIISGLLNLSKQRIISSTDIRNLYSEIAPQRPDTEVLMAQDFLGICRELGSEFFDNDESRSRIIEAAIGLVDDKVNAEDVWLENGGE